MYNLGKSALYYASERGHNESIEFLLHAGSDPSQILNAGWILVEYS